MEQIVAQCFPLKDAQTIIDAANCGRDRQIITKHFVICEKIMRMNEIPRYLIKQIHQKKAVMIDWQFYPIGPLAKMIYNTILYREEKLDPDRNVFPAWTTSDYENLMRLELSTATNENAGSELTQVYSRRYRLNCGSYSEFDKEAYSLSSETKYLTQGDLEIIHKYATEFIAFLKKWKRETKKIGSGFAANELKRIKKRFDWFLKLPIFNSSPRL